MTDNKFISLDEYISEEKFSVVNETMILEKGEDDEGPIGHIINRGLTYVPRAIRFSKAKKIMRRSLVKFISKAKNVVDKFAKSFQTKVATINPEYEKLKKEVYALVEEGKDVDAKNIMEQQLKELEDYQKDQMAILDKAISDIFQAYTKSIENRIDQPGFVLNVELSEKGKGELKAKWEELGASAKMKIDEHKTVLVQSKGWKKIDNMIAEIKAFVESRKYAGSLAGADFFIERLIELEYAYKVSVIFRVSGARFKTMEKGLLIADDESQLEKGKGAKVLRYEGSNRFQLGGFKMSLDKDKVPKGSWIRPYIVVKEVSEPIYGEAAELDQFLTGKDMETHGVVINTK